MSASRLLVVCAFAVGCAMLAGCQTAPRSEGGRERLHDDVLNAQKVMKAQDPSLEEFLDKSHGYVVFPNVGKGGLVVGGSYGRGEVFENGDMIGYADISQATVGLQAGGQAFSELLVFETADAMKDFKSGKLKFAANASAVALKTGAAASAKYVNGVAVFVRPTGGLMVEAAVGGQSFTFQPK